MTPQITRTDSLASYSEAIVVDIDVIYDFIVFTNTYTGFSSTDICDSCHTNNVPLCGNGVINAGEECDGTDLGGALCTDFGYISGTLSCSSSCEFFFGGCSTGGGGGPPPEEDTTAPNPGTASSPEYASTSPFTVTYSGAYDTGGSGLSYVTLFYKKGTGGWLNSGLTSTGGSGSFDFIPEIASNITYYFALQAFDNDGNFSNYPTGSGDTSTIYDAEAPTIETITIPESATSLPITISYENAVDVGISGLDHVELWYRQGEAGEWTDSELTNSSQTGFFDFEPTTGSDYYYFDLIAVDKAGNQSVEVSEYETPTMYDVDHPYITTVLLSAVSTAPIVIGYEGAIDIGPAGLKTIELWYKKEVTGIWTNSELTSTTTDGSFDFIPTTVDGTYYFDFILEDNVGNRSEEISGDGAASVVYAAEPFAAVLSNLPAETIAVGSVDIGVGGDDIVAYKYKINDDEYSDEIPVETNITLTDLPEGEYFLSVIGKHNMDWWQDISEPTTHTWEVVFPPPPPEPFAAVLSNLPAAIIDVGTLVDIGVGGDNIIAYKYKLNEDEYSEEILIDTNITLVDLPEGSYHINVIGKNNLGLWQDTADATTHTWEVLPPVEGPAEEPPAEEVAEEGEPDILEEEEPPAEEPPAEEPPAEEPPAEEPPAEEPPAEEPPAEEPPAEEPPAVRPSAVTPPEEIIEPEEEVEPEEEPEEEALPPPVELVPEITPPPPKILYSPEEIEEKAVEVIEEEEVVEETPVTVVLPETKEQVITRIDECKQEYPNLDFDSISMDADNDGLSNKTECYAFTNPLLADTDGDECLDGDEINQFSTDPLNGDDCKPEEKIISISSPQAGWLLAELEVTGLTPDDTSLVNLIAFPVVDNQSVIEEAIELGTINQFNPSSIENQYHFKLVPEVSLTDGLTYDLVAIGVFVDGQTITSAPIRFSLDSKSTAVPPKPLFIGNVLISDKLKLTNIRVEPSENGKVEVIGETEYGAQVFAIWESIVLASSVITDSALGEFSIESPSILQAGEDHEVTLYAVKQVEGQKLRSKNVEISFYIEKPITVPPKAVVLVVITLSAASLFVVSRKVFSLKRRLKNRV